MSISNAEALSYSRCATRSHSGGGASSYTRIAAVVLVATPLHCNAQEVYNLRSVEWRDAKPAL